MVLISLQKKLLISFQIATKSRIKSFYKGILNYHNKGSINLVHALKLKVSKIVPKSIFQYLEEVA